MHDPTTIQPADSEDDAAALTAACQLRRVDSSAARLIHHYSNAVYLLPHAGLVARVTRGGDAAHRMTLVDKVVRWLTDRHDFPATAAASGLPPVQLDDDVTVGFWTYYPQPTLAAPLTSAHLGELLRGLHALPDTPPVTLDAWVPLNSLEATLSSPAATEVLTTSERDWLHDEISIVRDDISRLDWQLGTGLIHGDAWAGNLLWDTTGTAHRAVLGDWDWVSHGPREIDLIPTWHAARRYGKGTAWSDTFVDRYGYDLSTWPGFAVLMHMRDLVQLAGPIRRATVSERHKRALRQRLDGIRSADVDEVWTAL